MTPKQSLYRWRFRHDFMEDWLAIIISERDGITKKKAVDHVRNECEMAMRRKGIKYPFNDDDK